MVDGPVMLNTANSLTVNFTRLSDPLFTPK